MGISDLPVFTIDIRHEDFDIALEINNLKNKSFEIGAIVSFLGLVRDVSKNRELKFMEIEHYPEMTKKVLNDLCNEASTRWSLQGISIIHRIGKLYPSENIVLLIVASIHRGEAFGASEFLMDFLKSHAPFWKKETTIHGASWIEEKEEDKQNLLRWRKVISDPQ